MQLLAIMYILMATKFIPEPCTQIDNLLLAGSRTTSMEQSTISVAVVTLPRSLANANTGKLLHDVGGINGTQKVYCQVNHAGREKKVF